MKSVFGLTVTTVTVGLLCWAFVRFARRRYGRSMPSAPGVDYTQPAPWRELIPALLHAGLLELTALCAGLFIIAVILLLDRVL